MICRCAGTWRFLLVAAPAPLARFGALGDANGRLLAAGKEVDEANRPADRDRAAKQTCDCDV